MAVIKLPDNGQEFTIDDEIAADDTAVQEVLRDSYPELGTPTIQRETRDGTLIVTVIKRPGSKG